jgi:hypothetical protein
MAAARLKQGNPLALDARCAVYVLVEVVVVGMTIRVPGMPSNNGPRLISAATASTSKGGRWMANSDELTLQVQPFPDGDADELMAITGRLRSELLQLDVAAVDPVGEAAAPERAKGLADLAGWLVVQLGTVSGLRVVVEAVGGWAARTHREVEINYGGDVLRVTGVSSAQQERIVDAWLVRHGAGP